MRTVVVKRFFFGVVFLFFFPFTYEAHSDAKNALMALMRSKSLRFKVFEPGKGWATRWATNRFGRWSEAGYGEQLGRLRNAEADGLMSRVLYGGEMDNVLAELGHPHSPRVWGGEHTTRGIIHRLFDFSGWAAVENFSFTGVSPRALLLQQRPTAAQKYADRFRDGLVTQRHRSTGRSEFWVRIRDQDFRILGLRHRHKLGLTIHKQTDDFIAGERGVAAVGNRFTVGRRDSTLLYMIDRNKIRIFRRNGENYAATEAEFHLESRFSEEGKIVAFGERGVEYGRWVAVMEWRDRFYLVFWRTNKSYSRFLEWIDNRVAGMKVRVPVDPWRALDTRAFNDGAIITGTRMSDLPVFPGKNQPDFAVDVINSKGELKSVYWTVGEYQTPYTIDFLERFRAPRPKF